MTDGDVVVALRDVSFTYRGAATPALRDVSLSVRRGEMVVVMGATGAGKTTLAKCIGRSIPQFQPGVLSGDIEVCGRDVGAATVSDLAGTVGLVSQDFEAQLFSTSVRHEVAFGMEQLGVARADMARRLADALAVVGLAGFDGRDPITLSGGEKQRLAIAALLALEPAVLVLDEPTTDLDPLGKGDVFAALAAVRARGATILLIEHETAAAERADRLVLMAGGAIVAAGPPAPLLADVGRLEALGVRPLDLDRIAQARGWAARPADATAAAQRLRPRAPTSLPPPVAPREPLIDAEGMVHAYAPGRPALAGVSLSIASGEFVALIGQNGSGKTTLAKCLNGLITPQQGTVRVRGTDLRELPVTRVAAEIGYVFQNPDQQIFAATVHEEVGFALANLGVPAGEAARRVAAVLEAVGLEGCAARDPFLLGKGQRQRLAVASLLVLEPAVLILDEPTTGLDFPEQRHLMALLAGLHRRGLTVVVITHSPWVVAEYAERGVVLRDGRVAFDGSLRSLFAEEALLEASHFRLPDATRVGRRLGFTPLSVEELLAGVEHDD
ncbi:MAG TPA: energy-coupling factor transporter ATPase [Candidatus Dormibacteraeota bacterium]|nr:energy-coupling factor transporter ATPase [Candidatus Dormibacteraeota bacterium]